MAETSFEVRYDGEALRDGRMPVRELAPALLALSRLFSEAGQLLYPENEPVALEIEATREGSFVVDLVLHAVGSGWDQFSHMDVGEGTTTLVLFKEFVIGDSIDDEGLTPRGPIVIASASSKTAIAAAFLLAQRGGVELIGLTSPANAEFISGLGIYDRCVGYDAIDSLGPGPASFVDVAGDAAVRHAVHSHYGDRLAHSMAVGISHWENLEGEGEELPGPRPSFFFAPDRVVKRSADWGRAGLEQRVAGAWHPFRQWTEGWLEVIHDSGWDGLQSAYREVLAGRVEPRSAHVVSLTPRNR